MTWRGPTFLKEELEDTFSTWLCFESMLETVSGGDTDITGNWADDWIVDTFESAAAFLKSWRNIMKIKSLGKNFCSNWHSM